MTDSTLVALRQLLLTSYDEIKARLTLRLGSSDLAGDAVQDAWLRLHHVGTVDRIRNPANYLFRVALNIARDRRMSERRHLSSTEIDQLINMADANPGPEAVIEARSELQLVEKLLAELPPRQRDILVAARLDGLPRREIADRLGISLSLVEKELKLAHEYCLTRRNELTE